MQSLEVARTWGLALVTAGLAGLLYAATALVGRLLTPWASSTPLPLAFTTTTALGHPVLRLLRPILLTLISAGLLLAIWLGFIRGLGLGLNPTYPLAPHRGSSALLRCDAPPG
ncbi:MAG: hypothetical protein ACJ736_04115 [Streptomyces sp.]